LLNLCWENLLKVRLGYFDFSIIFLRLIKSDRYRY